MPTGDDSALSDPYAALARCYDLDHAEFTDDLDFWLSLARQVGGPVLEVGCGSGRVLLPLARAGFEVVGIDPSAPMLARLRERLRAEPATARRVTAIEADARTLDLPGRRWPLAIATLGVFGHLLDHAEALAALRRLRAHLAPGGVLAVDLPNPLTLLDDEPDGLLFHDWTRPDPATGRAVMRWHSRRVDPVAQRIDTLFLYDEIGPDGTLRRTPAPVALRYYHASELALLLALAGFAVEHRYGDWELGDYAADGPRLIVLARAVAGPA